MVGTHEGTQLASVVVGRHEQVALVLVRVLTGRLGCSSQSLEIEFVCVPLSVHLRHDIFVVVISASKDRMGDTMSYVMTYDEHVPAVQFISTLIVQPFGIPINSHPRSFHLSKDNRPEDDLIVVIQRHIKFVVIVSS